MRATTRVDNSFSFSRRIAVLSQGELPSALPGQLRYSPGSSRARIPATWSSHRPTLVRPPPSQPVPTARNKRYGAARSASPGGPMAIQAPLPTATRKLDGDPGGTEENPREHQASFYRKPHDGEVCVVVGAGNVTSIPPTDVAYKMFVEGKACILKMNPVNAYLGPFLERAFRAAIEKGFFAVVYGGAEVGEYLVNHRLVDEVHITGSDKTHDIMVWAPPVPEREARKRR